jgi:glutathione S-transferase
MKAKLYVILGSHACRTGMLLLEHKAIPYELVELPTGLQGPMLRLRGFSGNRATFRLVDGRTPRMLAPADRMGTVPSLVLDGQRVKTNREISRFLDRLQPDPPLFPSDPELRAAVEEAERFGDEDLQSAVRRIAWNVIRRDRSVMGSYAEGARLGIPTGIAVRTGAPIVAASVRFNKASDENVRHDLAALPGMLKRIDDWCEAGVLDDDQLNVADFQIAPSIRLAMTYEDLRPFIESRPAGRLAMRVVPEFPGNAPAILPPAWLEPLREAAATAAA